MIVIYLLEPEYTDVALVEQVERELLRLHIPSTMDGFHYFAEAIVQTIPDPSRTRFITKGLYRDIAKRFGMSPANVMRGMRTALGRCWSRGGREALDEMAGIHLTERPTSSEFINLVAAYIRCNR